MKRKLFIILVICLLTIPLLSNLSFGLENIPNFIDFAYGRGYFVAIDDKGGIAISENCIDWNYPI